MATAYTSLLGLALPVTGELSGTWGDTVNTSITSLLDSAVAGTTNVSTDTDVTLTTTNGVANTAREAILLFSGARTALRTVTAPAQSKIYTIINATTGGFAVKLVGAGPTTGVTIANGSSTTVAWNGSDFVEVSSPSSIILPNGTANGVLYLNGSKVVTSGSALTFEVDTLRNTQSSGTNSYFRPKSGTVDVIVGAATTGLSTGAVFGTFSNDSVVFYQNSAEGMRLTSTGLGIGTSSPSYKLDVDSGATALMTRFNSTNANGGYILGQSSGTAVWDLGTAKQALNVGGSTDFGINVRSGFLSLGTGNTERMRLDSSGNLGLGVTPSAWSGFSSVLQQRGGSHVVGDTGAFMQIGANNYYNGTNWIYTTTAPASRFVQNNGLFQWFNAPSGTAGNAITFTQAMTLDASGNLLVGTTSSTYSASNRGVIEVNGASTSLIALKRAGSGSAYFLASSGEFQLNNTEATPMTFYVNGSERARIDSSGRLLVGTTTAEGAGGLTITPNGSAGAPFVVWNRADTASTSVATSFRNNGTAVGTISYTNTATLYNVTSDQRLKENIKDAAPASALIDSLQVREYDWKANGAHQRYGFIAQELVTVAPEAVYQPEDPEEMMAVDYSKLVPMLVKEIQSLRKRLADAGI